MIALLSQGHGRLFSSIETTLAAPKIYDEDRVRMRIEPKGATPYVVELEFGVEHIVADTTRSEIANGSEMAIVALLKGREGDLLTFEPLAMGGPIIQARDSLLIPDDQAMFLGFAYGEVFPEDIDEFARMTEVPLPTDIDVMREISEAAFKTCLAEILGERTSADWGGEQSDLFSAHVHVAETRTPTAFLLKGPARFAPMGLNHLGKNNDQIVRLSHEPATLLVVQHCHDIGQAVRDTLRAFAVQPGPLKRRYCLIDGRDSLRLLIAYGKLDRAKELSSSG